MYSSFSPIHQLQWAHRLNPLCGLYTTVSSHDGYRKFLPLVSVDIHTTIVSSTSRTVLTQTFRSPKTAATGGHLQNVSYVFPLYDGVSVVAFTCTVGSRVISGVVKERNEAKQAFNAAVAQGQTAGLLEQSLEASDVFATSLGNMPLDEDIKVDITYLGELKHDAQVDGLRFTIPMSVAQRYGHHTLSGPVTADREHLSITVDVDVSGGSTIRSVQSVSHPISVNIGTLSTATSEPPSLQRAHATLSQDSAALNKDFVVQVAATGLGDPVAVLETHPTIPNQRALMATLVPRFNLSLAMCEVVFMCDRSGSMGNEKKLPNVIEALKVFLKSLPVGIKFNICSFGSHYSFLWERSQTYDESSLRVAISHVSSFQADLGGTEMHAPMAEIFRRRYSDLCLQVFLLTDGETWNQEALFRLINSHVTQSKGAIRVFTLGVGATASHALIEGVARAGNGFSQAVADGERVDKMLVRMLKGALTPHVNDYTMEIKYGNNEVDEEEDDDDDDDDDDYEVIEKVMDAMKLEVTPTLSADIKDKEKPKIEMSLFDQSVQDKDLELSDTSDVKMQLPAVAVPRYLQAPFQIPPLFPFSRTTVYVLFSDSTLSRQPKSIILRGTSVQGPLTVEVPIAILPEKGTTIHQLAARKAIRELEDGRGWLVYARDQQGGELLTTRYDGQFSDMVKREAVRLGTQYQVSGRWCSFVAIEDGKDEADESQEAVTEDVDKANATDGPNTATSHQFRKRKAKNQENEEAKMKMRMKTQTTDIGSAAAGSLQMGMCMQQQQQQQQQLMARQASGMNLKPSMSSSAMTPQQRARVRQQAMAQQQAYQAQQQAQQTQQQAQHVAQQQAQLAQIQQQGQSLAMVSAQGKQMQLMLLEQQNKRRLLMARDEQKPPMAQTYDFSGSTLPAGGDVLQDFDFDSFLGQPEDKFDFSDNQAAPQSAPAVVRAPMSVLISEQTFIGNWDWTPRLEAIVGVTKSAALADMKLPGQYGQHHLVLATLCAVVYLKKKLVDEKDVWELIVQKAEDWLRNQTQEDVLELERIVERTLFGENA